MANNIQYANAIRKEASAQYQERIPVATQENIAEVTEAIMSYPNVKNEFIDVLTNKVSQVKFMNKLFNNPYKFFKKGSLPYGESIEAVFVDLIKGKDFSEQFGSSEAESVLGVEKANNVKVEYYSENVRNKYKISISNQQLKKAFMSADGLQRLVDMLVVAPLNSAEYDEFVVMKKLLSQIKMTEITISDYASAQDEQKAKMLTKLVKEHVYKFGFLSADYNSQGVMTFARPEECVILVTPEVKANLDVELLATAFHMEKADMEARLVLIDQFNDPDTLAILCDENLIQYYETLNETESFRNPNSLVTNTFFHRWAVAYGCGFVNALEIKKAK